MDHFAQAKENAAKTAESVRRFMSRVADGKVRATICKELAELDRLISTRWPPKMNTLTKPDRARSGER